MPFPGRNLLSILRATCVTLRHCDGLSEIPQRPGYMMDVQGMGPWKQEDYSIFLQFPEEILKRIIDFLTNPEHRNALSLVCKRLNAIEGDARETVSISNCYAIQPTALVSRFPNAKSITIKGKPRVADFNLLPHSKEWGAYAAPWVDVLVKFYRPVTHLKMKRMTISDSDIKRLLRACGRSLQRLELEKCSGFSTRGLDMIARACGNLEVLNLLEAEIENEGAPNWLTTLVESAKSLQVLDLFLTEVRDVEQHVVVELASRCHTLRLCEALKIDFVLPVVEAAKETVRHMGIGLYAQNVENPDRIAEAFGRCTGLQCLSLWNLDDGSMRMVMPIAARLTSLDLTYALLGEPDQLTDLLGTCANLEELRCTDIVGDRGLQEVGSHCPKLRKLVVQAYEAGFVTQRGLKAVAQGCFFLEEILFYATDMTNDALETLANNCLGLSKIRICVVHKAHDFHRPVTELGGSSGTLDLGVKALVMKCSRLRRLALCFVFLLKRFGQDNFVLVTDEGLSYIGQYGRNLQTLTLTNCGNSDAGFAFLAAGCKKLQRLELLHCPFGDASMVTLVLECPKLKQLWIQACQVELQGVKMLAQRPGLIVEVVKESSNENGVIAPWNLIAYSSMAPPRTDLPNNIDHIDENYCIPLSNEHFLRPCSIIVQDRL